MLTLREEHIYPIVEGEKLSVPLVARLYAPVEITTSFDRACGNCGSKAQHQMIGGGLLCTSCRDEFLAWKQRKEASVTA